MSARTKQLSDGYFEFRVFAHRRDLDELLESYGREVREAAAAACAPHGDDDAMDKQAKAECAKAIREMPLP